MPSNHTPDLLVVFTALLALLFSPALAAILAPYAVVFLGGLLGTGWALHRRPPADRVGTWGFVFLMLGTALILTMPAAVWLQSYLGAGTAQWMLGPLAAVIAGIGEDWPRVGAWFVGVGRRVIGRRVGVDE